MNLETIRQLVWQHKPTLKALIDENGSLTLIEYFKKIRPNQVIKKERQAELLKVIEAKVSNLISQEVSKSVNEELNQNFFVSTADHHQPLCHPFFSNANVVQSITNQEKGLKSILVLACSNISLNNSSYPRGILFHNQNLREERFPFFSLKYRHHPVFGLTSYQKEKLISHAKRHTQPVQNLVEEIYLSHEVLNLKTYSDQITKTNFELWKKIPGQSETNLIYLNQEEIVSDLILKHHLEESSIINQLIFNEKFLSLFEKFFDGVIGAFSPKNKKGTFLFWAIKNNHRLSLYLKGKKLMTENEEYKITLGPESIQKALEAKEILPSMALSFIVLSFYYGLPCGGGFSQINYFEDMKNAYLKILSHIDQKEKSLVESIPTDIFRGEFVLATLESNQKIIPATSIDLILYQKENTEQKIREFAEKVTLEEAIEQMMPEFYKVITGKKPETSTRKTIEPILNV